MSAKGGPMSGQVLPFDAATHKVVDVLLPWFVNGTLDGDERELVEQHLGQCKRCQQEVQWLQELQAACVAAAAPGASPAANQLHQRLTLLRPRQGAAGRSQARWPILQPWSRVIMVAQLAVIVLLGAVVAAMSADHGTPYRTLGAADSAGPATASLVVVFDPSTTELDLRRMVRAVGARIVDGPTQANAYLLDVPPEAREQALRTLKAERRVVLVEPLAADAR